MNLQAEKTLRDVVAGRIDARWEAWAAAHPNLARALERTRLIDTAVSRLRDDPAFTEALRRADLDEARLAQAAAVLEIAERTIARLLR